MQRQIRPSPFLKSLICTVCSVVIAIASSQVARATVNRSNSTLSSVGLSERQFEDEVKEYLGTPYRKGGTTKQGMDCSGFARTVYDQLLGLEIPHNSGDQFNYPELQKIDTRKLQAGDLVFFANKKKKRISHVGVYLSDGQFIHASSSEGIIVSSLEESYWKKRFVGSKRYMALSSVGGTDGFRLESYHEMPIHQSGAVTFYSKNGFRSNSPAQDDLETIKYDPLEVRTASLPQNFQEIGYKQNILNGFDISLNAFTEKFVVNNAWPESERELLSKGYGIETSFDTTTRQGLTLSSDYRPIDWMILTPSITYFDYSGNTDHLENVPKRSLGLNAQLTPQDSNWSLSMLVRYSDSEGFANFSNLDNKISSLDMAVKLGIAVTENLQFSIMSKYDKRSLALRATDDSSLNQPNSSDVALMFDFSY